MRTSLLAALLVAFGSASGAGQDSPSPRFLSGAAYDVGRHRLVLFGGLDESNGFLGDTWEWDGQAWHEVTPVASPSPRAGHGMIYDPVRHHIVLFGGGQADGALNDTWIYDGETWVQVTADSAPPGRMAAVVQWNPDRQSLVISGGRTMNGTLSDTWELTGTRWHLMGGTPEAATGAPATGSVRARALEAMVKSDLRNLVTAQEAFFADNNRYARNMDELHQIAGYQASNSVTITLVEPKESSWGAIGTHLDMAGARCVIYVGEKSPFPEATDEGRPVCSGFR